jgi:hypothetical protein
MNSVVDGDNGSHPYSPYYVFGHNDFMLECDKCYSYFDEEDVVNLGGWNNFRCKECCEDYGTELKQSNK